MRHKELRKKGISELDVYYDEAMKLVKLAEVRTRRYDKKKKTRGGRGSCRAR